MIRHRSTEKERSKESQLMTAAKAQSGRKVDVPRGVETEKEIQDAREYAENILETIHEPLVVMNSDLQILSANLSFYDTFKVTPEETIGKFIYDLGNRQWDIPKLRILLENILPQNTVFNGYEVEHDFLSVGRKIMLLNARQIFRKSIGSKIILMAIQDITERKRLEGLLAESELRFRRLFETASDGILLLEKREGTIAHVNPAAINMTGYSEEECIGNKLQNIGVSINTDDFQAIMQSLAKCGIINYSDVPLKTKSGQNIYADIYLVDRAVLAQCNIRDVTGRKLANDFKDLALKEKTVMLQEIHHRVKNNLAVIGSLLDLQAQGIDDAAVRAKFLESRNRVLAMSMIHEKLYQSADMAHVDFKEYLQGLIAGIVDTYKQSSVTVSVEMEPVFLDVNVGIPCALITNELVANSLKYAFPAGRKGTIKVGITLDSKGARVLFVEDNGVGLPASIDFRNTSSLGLQLVNGLTRQIRGKIELSTGAGTRFSITLPDEAKTLRNVADTVQTKTRTQAKRIMVVEDECITAMALQSNLIELGYEVPAIVDSGEDAIRNATELHPDLILMDIKLNGPMSGIQAAAEIRKAYDIPIIYFTAHSDTELREKTISTEPFRYLPKQSSIHTIQRILETALSTG